MERRARAWASESSSFSVQRARLASICSAPVAFRLATNPACHLSRSTCLATAISFAFSAASRSRAAFCSTPSFLTSRPDFAGRSLLAVKPTEGAGLRPTFDFDWLLAFFVDGFRLPPLASHRDGNSQRERHEGSDHVSLHGRSSFAQIEQARDTAWSRYVASEFRP